MTQYADPWLPTGFRRRDDALYVDDVPLAALCARYGTPLYVYSATHVRERLRELRDAFAGVDATVCYAVKANDNHGLLRLCADAGTGFDVVSGGELQRALRAGATPGKIVFSGVGKTDAELAAALRGGVLAINLESAAEAERLAEVAAGLGLVAPVAVRINPDVDPGTHPKIATGMATSKFGIGIEEAADLYRRLSRTPSLVVRGLAFHIGSQLLDPAPLEAAIDRALALVRRLRDEGIDIAHLDVGGGFGIRYVADQPTFDVRAYAARVRDRLRDSGCRIVLEPGRFLVGNAGVLCARVLYEKTTQSGRGLTVVDAAMNDLLRPALYDAVHTVVPLRASGDVVVRDVVGPVCESSDVLARDVRLPAPRAGDGIALLSAGAYGSVMSGTYNTRPRPAELLVDGDRVAVLRSRESLEEVLARDRLDLEWRPWT